MVRARLPRESGPHTEIRADTHRVQIHVELYANCPSRMYDYGIANRQYRKRRYQ